MRGESAGLDRGSWPTPLGSLRSDRRATLPIQGIGRVRYSVALSSAAVRAISVGSSGLVCVAAGERLVGVRGDQLRWCVEAAPFGGCLLLSRDLLVVADLDGLVVRSQGSGELIGRLSSGGMSSAPAVVGEWLVFAHDDGAGRRELRAVTLDGSSVWTQPLAQWSSDAPVVVDGGVAVTDGARVRWFSADGAPRAQHRMPDGAEVVGQLVGVGSQSVLARYQGYSATGFGICSARQAEMRSLPAHLRLREPLATDGQRLALSGWELDGPDGQPRESLDVVALSDGRLLHREILHNRVVGLAMGATGQIAFAASPTRERWQAYSHFPNFAESTSPLVGLLVGDTLAATWTPPAPIVGPLAVGPSGDLLVPAGDRLYALTRS